MVRELRSVNEANGLVLSQLLLFANLFFFFSVAAFRDELGSTCQALFI